MPGARAAEFFRDRDAEKAHLGKALPQFAVIGLLAVKHDPHGLGRALFSEKFSRFVAHLFLFVGEIEVHVGVLRWVIGSSVGWVERSPSRTLVAVDGFRY